MNSLRKFLNDHAIVVVSVAAFLLLVGVTWGLVRSTGDDAESSTEPGAWLDTNTGEYFRGPVDAQPPIEAPSGPRPDGRPAGVRVYTFACGHCGPDSEIYVSYFETQLPVNVEPPANKKENPGQWLEYQQASQRARRVRPPGKDTKWIPYYSEEGQDVTLSADRHCRPQPAVPCLPDRLRN